MNVTQNLGYIHVHVHVVYYPERGLNFDCGWDETFTIVIVFWKTIVIMIVALLPSSSVWYTVYLLMVLVYSPRTLTMYSTCQPVDS